MYRSGGVMKGEYGEKFRILKCLEMIKLQELQLDDALKASLLIFTFKVNFKLFKNFNGFYDFLKFITKNFKF